MSLIEMLSATTHDEVVADVELGARAAILLFAGPLDTPQFPDGLMYWERGEAA